MRSLILCAGMLCVAGAVRVASSGNEVQIEWNITDSIIEFEFYSEFGAGWFGWGVNNVPFMASADIFWIKRDSTQIQLADAYASSTTNPSIDAQQDFFNITTQITSTTTRVRATRYLNTNDNKDHVIMTDGTPQYLIYAFNSGNYASSYAGLTGHSFSNRGYFQVDFASNNVTKLNVPKKTLWKVHGWLMFWSWGVFIPSGVMLARYTQTFFPSWFHLHRIFNLFGLVVGIAGIAIGYYMSPKTSISNDLKRHKAVGTAVLILGILNPLVAVIRPHKERGVPLTPKRKVWYALHFSIGITALGCAISNIFLGAKIYNLNMGLFWAMSAWFILLAVVIVFSEMFLWKRKCGKKPDAANNTEMKHRASGK